MVDETLMLNSFGKPIELKDDYAVIQQLYNLITMAPGCDIINPDKGCDIIGWFYKYDTSENLSDLSLLITNQVHSYTPYSYANVVCKSSSTVKNKHLINIIIYLMPYSKIAVFSTNGKTVSAKMIDKP